MIYLTGDTHGEMDIDKLSSQNFPEGKELTKNDYLIILGDFGLIWKLQSNPQEKYWLDWLDEKLFTTLFVPGNHENFDRLLSDEFPEVEMFGSKVKQISKSVFMLQTGHVYTIDDKKCFVYGGGESIDKVDRVEGISWWPQELPSKREEYLALENLKNNGNKVDLILSHTSSEMTFNKIAEKFDMSHKEGFEQSIRNFFNHIEDTIEYQKWFFGHYHINFWKVDEKHITMYNKIISLSDIFTNNT